jgi:hypothetical protein
MEDGFSDFLVIGNLLVSKNSIFLYSFVWSRCMSKPLNNILKYSFLTVAAAVTLLSICKATAGDLILTGQLGNAYDNSGNTVTVVYERKGIVGRDSRITGAEGKYSLSIMDGGIDDPIKDTNLKQNYPNPFNGSTKLQVTLTDQTHVDIRAYNSLGQEIAQVLDKDLAAGTHTIAFNLDNLASNHLGDGVYFFRMDAQGKQFIRKAALVHGASASEIGTSIDSDIFIGEPVKITGVSFKGPDLANNYFNLNRKPDGNTLDLGKQNINPATTSTRLRTNVTNAFGDKLEGTVIAELNRANSVRNVTSFLLNGFGEVVDHVDVSQIYPSDAELFIQNAEVSVSRGNIIIPINQKITSPIKDLNLKLPPSMGDLIYTLELDSDASIELFGRAGANPIHILGQSKDKKASLIYKPNPFGVYSDKDIVAVDSLKFSGENIFPSTSVISKQINAATTDLGKFNLNQAVVINGRVYKLMEWKKSESENGLEGADVTIAGFKTISGKNGYYSVRIPAGLDSVDADVDHGLIYPRRTKLFLPSGKLDINVVDTLNFSKKLMGVYNFLMRRGEGWPAARTYVPYTHWVAEDTSKEEGLYRFQEQVELVKYTNELTKNPLYPNGALENTIFSAGLNHPEPKTPPFRWAADGYYICDWGDTPPNYFAATGVDVNWVDMPIFVGEIRSGRTTYRKDQNRTQMKRLTKHEYWTFFTNAIRLDMAIMPSIFNWSGTEFGDETEEDRKMIMYHFSRIQSRTADSDMGRVEVPYKLPIIQNQTSP